MTDLIDCVLVVEDEFVIAEYLTMILEDLGRTVCGIADNAREAIRLAHEHRPFLVLMDVRLKGPEDGVQAAIAIQQEIGSKVVFVTGSREPANLKRMEEGRPAAILFKPLRPQQLESTLAQVLAP